MSHTKPSPGPQISQLDGLWKKKCTRVQVCTCMEMNLSLLIAVMQLSVMTKYLRKNQPNRNMASFGSESSIFMGSRVMGLW